MGFTLDTLPDRHISLYHTLRSTEVWHGIVLKIVDPDKRKTIKSGLDKILKKNDYTPSIDDKIYLYSEGAYEPHILKKITKYIADQNQSESVVCKGKYEDFAGSRWLRKVKQKYGWD